MNLLPTRQSNMLSDRPLYIKNGGHRLPSSQREKKIERKIE